MIQGTSGGRTGRAGPPEPAILRSGWKRWALYLGAALAVALLFAAQYVAYWAATDKPYGVAEALSWNLLFWGAWALLAPAVYALAGRVRLDRESWRAPLAVHLLAGVAAGLLHSALFLAGNEALGLGLRVSPTVWEGYLNMASRHVLPHLLTYGVVVAGRHLVDFYALYRQRELRSSRLETELAEAELRALRMQLQPHFLFNTLNTIAGLIHDEPDRADRVLTRLATLLRSVIDESREQEVPLRRELETLEPYLEIERIRFGDRLTLEVDVPDDCLDARVPSLLLQPLVENAVRHGTGRSPGAGRVEVRAARAGDRLRIEILDTGPGPEDGAPRGDGSGVGLGNTLRRVDRLYGSEGRVRLEPRDGPDGEGARVVVEIPFRSGEAPVGNPESEGTERPVRASARGER